MKLKNFFFNIQFASIVSIFLLSCKKLVEVGHPRTDLITTTVFASDATANAAILDIYFSLKNNSFANGSNYGVSFLNSLAADDIIHYQDYEAELYQQFNDNTLQPENSILALIWTQTYELIYKCNAALEGLEASAGLSVDMKTQLDGEVRFVRSFCYFYLLNWWGDVPLVLTTNYKINNSIPRSTTEKVYEQIVADLKIAKASLPQDYVFANNERVRATKGAATAMLARVYLYQKDYTNAEEQASEVIRTTSLYNLELDLALVYRTTSPEAILQLWSNQTPADRYTFGIYPWGFGGGGFSTAFMNGIEAGDQRWSIYGDTVVAQGSTYYGAYKYKDFSIPPLDYSTLLRLAEQYLIRAEARAQQGKLTGLNSAESDLNIIRNRAGLGNTTASTKESILIAIEQERQYEFFTEMGHRWFDLKRTGRAAAILGHLKPGGWQQFKELFPIPEIQIVSNPNVTQNPGY